MPISMLYWMFWILALFFSVWASWPLSPVTGRPFGFFIFVMVMLFLIGLHDFGFILTR